MKNKKNTEERILEAAIKVFAEKGFSAATTSEIAKEANVAEGTIFRYFPKKKELLHGIVYRVIDLFGEDIVINSIKQTIEKNKDKEIKELLKAIILDRVDLFKKYSSYFKVIVYEIQFHKDIRQLFIDKIAKKAIEIGKSITEEGKLRDEFKDIDSLIAFRSFVGMVFMMLIQREFMPAESSFENIEEEIDIILEIFLKGIKK